MLRPYSWILPLNMSTGLSFDITCNKKFIGWYYKTGVLQIALVISTTWHVTHSLLYHTVVIKRSRGITSRLVSQLSVYLSTKYWVVYNHSWLGYQNVMWYHDMSHDQTCHMTRDHTLRDLCSKTNPTNADLHTSNENCFSLSAFLECNLYTEFPPQKYIFHTPKPSWHSHNMMENIAYIQWNSSWIRLYRISPLNLTSELFFWWFTRYSSYSYFYWDTSGKIRLLYFCYKLMMIS